jgi:hypothetical protein
MRAIAFVVIIAGAASACITPYQPKANKRIQVLDAVGVRTFEKDGAIVSDGLFGGGLYDIVANDARAADDAAAHRTDITWSVGVGGVSVASAAAGAILLLSGQRGLVVPGALAVSAGALGTIPFTILQLTADTHLWKAINMYNDDVDAAGPCAARNP